MPAVDPSKPPQAKADGSWYNWNTVYAKEGTPSSWKRAKRVWVKQIVPPSNTSQWVEVWNSRPEISFFGFAVAGSYDRFTAKANVVTNGFSTTARLFYRVKNVGAYIDSGAFPAQLTNGVVERTITGLSEQTTYQYYFYAENECGVAQTSVEEITTPSNCAVGFVLTSTVTTTETCDACECGSNTRNKTVKTYSKSGCPSYTTTEYTTCTGCGTWDYYDAPQYTSVDITTCSFWGCGSTTVTYYGSFYGWLANVSGTCGDEWIVDICTENDPDSIRGYPTGYTKCF